MGRKKMAKTAKSNDIIEIRVRVNPDMHRRVSEAAEADGGRSIASYVRAMIAREMKRRDREGVE